MPLQRAWPPVSGARRQSVRRPRIPPRRERVHARAVRCVAGVRRQTPGQVQGALPALASVPRCAYWRQSPLAAVRRGCTARRAAAPGTAEGPRSAVHAQRRRVVLLAEPRADVELVGAGDPGIAAPTAEGSRWRAARTSSTTGATGWRPGVHGTARRPPSTVCIAEPRADVERGGGAGGGAYVELAAPPTVSDRSRVSPGPIPTTRELRSEIPA